MKPVAYEDNTVAKEDLPFPWVLYPGHYGVFFGFQTKINSSIFFCSCAYEAIENYAKYRSMRTEQPKSDGSHTQLFPSSAFPYQFTQKARVPIKTVPNVALRSIKFKDKLCHECNRVTPSYSYCVAMYGGVFKQTYGWYLNKQAHEFGINPSLFTIYSNSCPDELKDVVTKIDPNLIAPYDQVSKTADWRLIYELGKKRAKIVRAIERFIENEVRWKFGHSAVGEAWTSETILYYMVKKFLPQTPILRHYRPEFLHGLELDIYLPDYRVAIEYQGVQHFKPVEHWGGEPALKALRERDARKMKECLRERIQLIYFTHREDLCIDKVREKLRTATSKQTS